MPEARADVVIVGAGIVGCAAAYYLARRGIAATVVEKERVSGAQSRQNWGFVRQQGRDPLEVPLMMEANRIWQTLAAELGADIGWVCGGNLALAATPQKLALFEDWAKMAAGHGLKTEILTPAQIRDLIPSMHGTWLGGMFTRNDGHAEPEKVTRAFAAAAQRHGAQIVEHCAVEAIETAAGAVDRVRTEKGDIRTRCVVVAAGAWSSRLLRPLGVKLPQRLVRSTVARTTAIAPLTQVGVWGPGVAFRQRPDGTCNLGGGGWSDHDVTLESLRHARLFLPNYWKNRKLFQFHFGKPFFRDLAARIPGTHGWRHPFAEPAQDSAQPNPAKANKTFGEFCRLFPHLNEVRLKESWAGYIDATPDAIPVIDSIEAVRGLVVATGFSGHGFGMGPISGRLVAELVADGKTSLDIHGFRFSRFADGTFGKPRSVM